LEGVEERGMNCWRVPAVSALDRVLADELLSQLRYVCGVFAKRRDPKYEASQPRVEIWQEHSALNELG
jgi:hypothetical protein